MIIIVIHVKNNMVDNVLLDGGLGMNAIAKIRVITTPVNSIQLMDG
jgi:hypothetical protein